MSIMDHDPKYTKLREWRRSGVPRNGLHDSRFRQLFPRRTWPGEVYAWKPITAYFREGEKEGEVTNDPAIYTLGVEELIQFMRRLRDAGMAPGDVAKHGFEYALGFSEKWRGESIPRVRQLHYASFKLERAARDLGISIHQQRQGKDA